MTVERPLRLAGIDPNRVYKTAEIKALKESSERRDGRPTGHPEDSQARHARPPRYAACLRLPSTASPRWWSTSRIPDLRDTEQIPLQEPGGIDAFLRREVLPYALGRLVPARQRQGRL